MNKLRKAEDCLVWNDLTTCVIQATLNELNESAGSQKWLKLSSVESSLQVCPVGKKRVSLVMVVCHQTGCIHGMGQETTGLGGLILMVIGGVLMMGMRPAVNTVAQMMTGILKQIWGWLGKFNWFAMMMPVEHTNQIQKCESWGCLKLFVTASVSLGVYAVP